MARPTRLFAGLVALLGIAAMTAPVSAQDFPSSWFYRQRPSALKQLEGKKMPKLYLTDWIGDEVDMRDLEGKVVVVDFWATWCGPCMAAIPKNIAMMDKYDDEDFVIIGVHDSRNGVDRMASVASQKGINYPLAVDRGGKSTKAWRVAFWPTYAVVDRKGIVRGIGLQPNHVGKAVDKLLKEKVDESGDSPNEDVDAPRNDGVPEEWLETKGGSRDHLRRLEENAANPPAIDATEWINSDALNLDDLKGKVVMIDFWATWCGPCMSAIPHTNELHEQYKDEGLVIIGVCHPRDVEKMAAVAEERGIKYPICADTNGKITLAYNVNGFPDYYFIDRAGNLRIADCKNSHVDDAVRMLLAEEE